MKTFKTIIAMSVLIMLISSCKKEQNEFDKEKPIISMSFQDAFPLNCDTLYFGEAFNLKTLFTDNRVRQRNFTLTFPRNRA